MLRQVWHEEFKLRMAVPLPKVGRYWAPRLFFLPDPNLRLLSQSSLHMELSPHKDHKLWFRYRVQASV
ncbi:hypothetical protein EYC80_008435 [Monilinia laxa]|uniref:Uncharacterized protein n=1 Tax=Monilinia laxa TaxID=61186 RepID=A0A5N6JRN8_MONLA|nr:hypothetical protein EYC80_008435 [Monilinia laxa]